LSIGRKKFYKRVIFLGYIKHFFEQCLIFTFDAFIDNIDETMFLKNL